MFLSPRPLAPGSAGSGAISRLAKPLGMRATRWCSKAVGDPQPRTGRGPATTSNCSRKYDLDRPITKVRAGGFTDLDQTLEGKSPLDPGRSRSVADFFERQASRPGVARVRRQPPWRMVGTGCARRGRSSRTSRGIVTSHSRAAQPRTALKLLSGCGLGASETIALERPDVDLDATALRADANRPGRQLATVPKQRAGGRAPERRRALLVSAREHGRVPISWCGDTLTRQGLSKIVQRHARAAALTNPIHLRARRYTRARDPGHGRRSSGA